MRALSGLFLLGLAATARGEQPAPPPPGLASPSLAQDSPAHYPQELLAGRIAGVVQLWVDVDEEGAVSRVEVAESSDPGFDAAALHAATALRFVPARLDGKPIPVRIAFSYRFVPPAEAGPAEAAPALALLRGQ